MGDNKMAWKVRVKNEDELYMDKHKPGKVRKIFTAVFVFVCIVVALLVVYKNTSHEETDVFLECLEKGDYEAATKIFDFEKNYETLVDVILKKRIEYDKTGKKEDFDDMWELIFSFESQIRVSDKIFYEDLKYFPKEEKVLRIGYDTKNNGTVWQLEEYYTNIVKEYYCENSRLYNYYLGLKFVCTDTQDSEEEKVDLLINNKGFDIVDKENSFAREFMKILEKEMIVDSEVTMYD